MGEFGIDLTGVTDGVAWIVLRNPARHNALRLEMWQAIPDVVAAVNADPNVRVCVLRGFGNEAFASGADISEFESQRKDPQSAARSEAITDRAFTALLDFEKPLIAMVHETFGGHDTEAAVRGESRRVELDALHAFALHRLDRIAPQLDDRGRSLCHLNR
jgi:enoyl-CoA hydratase/carnithine racemase